MTMLAPCPFCGKVPNPPAEIVGGKVWAIDCRNILHSAGAMSWTSAEHCAEQWSTRAAIRAAVGGEAVAWAHKDGMRILKDDGEGSLYLTSERQDEYGQTIPLYTSPPATVDVGVLRKALNDIREAVTQEPEDKFGYSQVDHGSGIPRAYSVRENILYTIDRRLAALIGKEV